MAKCLYGALFDWIVLQVNHALLSKKDTLRYQNVVTLLSETALFYSGSIRATPLEFWTFSVLKISALTIASNNYA